MRIIKALAFAFICFLIGGAAMYAGFWPMNDLRRAYEYVTDINPWHDISPREAIWNDLGWYPYRNIAPLPAPTAAPGEFKALIVPGMRERRASPQVYIDQTKQPAGLTLVAGLIDTSLGLHGAVLLDETGSFLHQWSFRTDPLNLHDASGLNDYGGVLHGLQVLKDGSIVVSFNGAAGFNATLTRHSPCGNVIWSKKINAHHAVTSDDEGFLWTFDNNDIIRVNSETGQIVDRISIQKLAQSDPGRYLLHARAFFIAEKGNVFGADPFHPNDVEALPASIADAFPDFDAGDLLVSLRTGNLIMVVDPNEHKIKWWMQNGSYAQHDPDWQPDGTITLFDNNTNFGPSRIIRIDPTTKDYEVLLEGEDVDPDFYTDLQGTHELQPNGDILSVLPRQGRVLSFDQDGRRIFEFRNLYSEADQLSASVTEAFILPNELRDIVDACPNDMFAQND